MKRQTAKRRKRNGGEWKRKSDRRKNFARNVCACKRSTTASSRRRRIKTEVLRVKRALSMLSLAKISVRALTYLTRHPHPLNSQRRS